MGRTIRKMDMKVLDVISSEQVCEITGISSAERGFYSRAIFLSMRLDQGLGPSFCRARFLFPKLKNGSRWSVVNWRLQLASVRMANGCERRMDRTNCKGKSKAFEGQHLGIAKSLRENRVTRIEISEPHVRISENEIKSDNEISSSGIRYHRGNLFEIRSPKSKSREPNVFSRIHFEIEDQRIGCVRFYYFLDEFNVDRVFAKDIVPVH